MSTLTADQKYTKTPNYILDELLPYLTGDELKVLMVAVRQSFGYHVNQARISVTRFVEKSGLSKPTVIKVLKSLKQFNVLKTLGKATRDGTLYKILLNADVNGLRQRNDQKSRKQKQKMRSIKKEVSVNDIDQTEEDPPVNVIDRYWSMVLTAKWLMALTHKRNSKENSKEKRTDPPQEKEVPYTCPETGKVFYLPKPIVDQNNFVNDMIAKGVAQTRL